MLGRHAERFADVARQRRLGRVGSSAIVPPAKCVGSILPSTTSASVTVGAVPPRP